MRASVSRSSSTACFSGVSRRMVEAMKYDSKIGIADVVDFELELFAAPTARR